jgi:hypothetical protein
MGLFGPFFIETEVSHFRENGKIHFRFNPILFVKYFFADPEMFRECCWSLTRRGAIGPVLLNSQRNYYSTFG